MKKIVALILSVVMTLTLIGCGKNNSVKTIKNDDNKENIIKAQKNIVRRPGPSVGMDRVSMGEEFPKYDPNSDEPFQVDLRNADLTKYDLSKEIDTLLFADFNNMTKWPENMPEEFDYRKIMELGKDPGLGIRDIHASGITGKGVGIGIIDQVLLVDHEEFSDNIKLYEEIGEIGAVATMHGSAVSSVAVGENCGVAPEADLYYIATYPGVFEDGEFTYDFTNIALAIERLLEVNEQLDENNKIRVISISVGWVKGQLGYDKISEAIDHAKKEGILVVSSSLEETYGYKFNGLGRDSLDNPNDVNSYKLCEWQQEYVSKVNQGNFEDTLFVPMDSRTTASENAIDDYVFYRVGGWSWSIPYIAGMYALCCEANPNITYEEFWEAALNTAEAAQVNSDAGNYTIPKVLCPKKLIEAVKK